ncbi:MULTISPECIES: hypothetical protein [Trichocoleus]|nr:hypothetical protein [Trichocoleus sp. FACHB-46]
MKPIPTPQIVPLSRRNDPLTDSIESASIDESSAELTRRCDR